MTANSIFEFLDPRLDTFKRMFVCKFSRTNSYGEMDEMITTCIIPAARIQNTLLGFIWVWIVGIVLPFTLVFALVKYFLSSLNLSCCF